MKFHYVYLATKLNELVQWISDLSMHFKIEHPQLVEMLSDFFHFFF